MTPALELQVVAVVAAVACALPGGFLLLRRQALLSDAMSHSVLLGIVVAFLLVGSLDSPWLVAGASLAGLLLVALVDLLQRDGRVREDAALGLAFPLLFSVAVILVSRFADHVHLDTDAVLLGELAFAPFRRLELGGLDLPVALWQMGGLLLLNLGFLLLAWKDLALGAFDPLLAGVAGGRGRWVRGVELGLLSLTCVLAFDAVGSVLVVALTVTPAATARLLSDRLGPYFLWLAGLAAAAALLGWRLAVALDASIAGSMAVAGGLLFLAVLLFAPGRGWLASMRRRREQVRTFERRMLVIHLHTHLGGPDEEEECRVGHLGEHLGWTTEQVERRLRLCREAGWVERRGERLLLSDAGHEEAHRALSELPLGSSGARGRALFCPWPAPGA